jgi:hypothetical protein
MSQEEFKRLFGSHRWMFYRILGAEDYKGFCMKCWPDHLKV